MMSAVDDIEMRLIASGYVVGEWTATEIAQVIAPEVEALRGQTEAMMRIIERDTAAIQRVREAASPYNPQRPDWRFFVWQRSGWDQAIDEVIFALDGGDR